MFIEYYKVKDKNKIESNRRILYSWSLGQTLKIVRIKHTREQQNGRDYLGRVSSTSASKYQSKAPKKGGFELCFIHIQQEKKIFISHPHSSMPSQTMQLIFKFYHRAGGTQNNSRSPYAAGLSHFFKYSNPPPLLCGGSFPFSSAFTPRDGKKIRIMTHTY